ncbi:unnamed protein product [Acanthoscelides obtectus]|uniref:Reverse transcriptase Ty1/copia-type domain-containing protein n=1 Tax=Acanthoscelides obtectus TaxID=200917 RepID=A0A9P0QI81_ACAOB|nr:unnamed protein product [Acanthoscelides obtectus]CAK1689296.1 hypothetical protein AOBTE_LOCUS37153 [Acanthoscelides obtectus]
MYLARLKQQPRIDDGDEASTRAVEAWTKGDSKAMSDIILSISPSEIKQKSILRGKATFEKTEGAMFVKRNYGKNHGHAGNGGRGSGVSEGTRGSGVSEGARGSGVSEGRRTFQENESETYTIEVQLSPVVENENPEHESPTTEQEEPEVDHDSEPPRRARGRPRIRRTGSRGRPRKIYRYRTPPRGSALSSEEVLLSEVPMHQAVRGEDADEWHKAMADEVASILKNGTWELIDRPCNQHIVGSRIVLRNKYKPDGTIERRKARLVARGFSQKPGTHFNETFAPVARLSSIRLVSALAAHLNMDMQQLDVTCAYLNGSLDETIYMETPEYLDESLKIICDNSKYDEATRKKARDTLNTLGKGDKVCLLRKSLYGLKQAGRSWYQKLSQTLSECGANPTNSDPCVFTCKTGKDIMIIVTYVDDLIIASRDKKAISSLKAKLSERFEMKDLGSVNHCLGMEFSLKKNKISLSQRAYILEIRDRFKMADANTVSTPLDPGTKLRKPTESPSSEELKLPYRELIGALTYLSLGTRPDISFAVSYLGQFNNCYTKEHWTAAKRVLRYLKGTIDHSIVYQREDMNLRGFVDADWANCPDDRHSYTGFSFILSGGPVSWNRRSKPQWHCLPPRRNIWVPPKLPRKQSTWASS